MLLTKTLLVTTVAATALAGAALVAAGPALASPTVAGTYNSVAPTRVLDTRIGKGAPKAEVPAHGTVTFSAVGPLKTMLVSAEALTITAASPVDGGYLSAYPGGTPRPATSTLNFAAGRSTANAAIVPYGAAGAVSVYNGSAHAVDIVADLFGYWTGGSVAPETDGAYNPLPSKRLVDTRSPSAPVAAGATVDVDAADQAGIPDSGVGAVVVNLAVVAPKVGGYLTATAAADDQQGGDRTSDVSFSPGLSRANLVVVPLDPATGTFSVRNGSAAPVNLVVDVVGYFAGGQPSADGSFVSSLYRNSDTRPGSIAAGATTKVDLGVSGDPSLFKAVVATVTAVGAKSGGYFTVWSGTGARPITSALNFTAGTTTAGTVIVPLNADGTFSLYNGSAGSVALVVDVHGYLLNDLSGDAPARIRSRLHTVLNHARSSAASRLAS